MINLDPYIVNGTVFVESLFNVSLFQIRMCEIYQDRVGGECGVLRCIGRCDIGLEGEEVFIGDGRSCGRGSHVGSAAVGVGVG